MTQLGQEQYGDTRLSLPEKAEAPGAGVLQGQQARVASLWLLL